MELRVAEYIISITSTDQSQKICLWGIVENFLRLLENHYFVASFIIATQNHLKSHWQLNLVLRLGGEESFCCVASPKHHASQIISYSYKTAVSLPASLSKCGLLKFHPSYPKMTLYALQISENPSVWWNLSLYILIFPFLQPVFLRWCFVNVGDSGEPLTLLSHKRRSEHIKSLVEPPKLYSY